MFTSNYIRFITIIKNDLPLFQSIISNIRNTSSQESIKNELLKVSKKIKLEKSEIVDNIEKDLRMNEIREHCIKSKIDDLQTERKRLKEDFNFLIYLKSHL